MRDIETKPKAPWSPHPLLRASHRGRGKGSPAASSLQQPNEDLACHLPREPTPQLSDRHQFLFSNNTADPPLKPKVSNKTDHKHVQGYNPGRVSGWISPSPQACQNQSPRNLLHVTTGEGRGWWRSRLLWTALLAQVPCGLKVMGVFV